MHFSWQWFGFYKRITLFQGFLCYWPLLVSWPIAVWLACLIWKYYVKFGRSVCFLSCIVWHCWYWWQCPWWVQWCESVKNLIPSPGAVPISALQCHIFPRKSKSCGKQLKDQRSNLSTLSDDLESYLKEIFWFRHKRHKEEKYKSAKPDWSGHKI